MSTVNIGTVANDGTGDSLRVGMGKVNTAVDDLILGEFPSGALGDAIQTELAAVGLDIASATPTLGSFYFIPDNTEVTVAVPGDAATVEDAYNGIAHWQFGAGSSVAIVVTGAQSAVTDLGELGFSDGRPITIRGATAALDLTFSSFDAPSGSAGSRSIGINVSSTTGASVGDVVLVNGYANAFPASGSQTLAAAPVSGSFQFGYNILGNTECRVTCAAGSTALTFQNNSGVSQTVSTTILPVGSILIMKGQIRRVTARPTDQTATLSAALEKDVDRYIYWALFKGETGTISATAGSGTSTGTGSGTSINTIASPGDYVIVPDEDIMTRFTAISGPTSFTLSGEYTFSAKNFAVVVRSWEMEVAMEITAVTATKITCTHKGWSSYAPPYRNLTPTTLKVIRNSVEAITDGFDFKGGGVSFDNIAIIGASVGTGLDLSNVRQAGVVNLSATAPVIGFNTGANVQNGMSLQAPSGYICGQSYASIINTYGGVLEIGGAIVGHAGYFSIINDLSSPVYWSQARLCCNGENSIYGEVGGSSYSDFAVASGNAERALQLIGQFQGHIVGCLILGNAGTGADFQNGGSGRFSGSFVACGGNEGVNVTTGEIEASYMQIIGNTGNAISLGGGAVVQGEHSGIGRNGGYAYQGSNARLILSQSWISKNNGGILPQKLDLVDLTGSFFDGNTAGGRDDCYTYAGAKVYVEDHLGSPTFNRTLNTAGPGYCIIFDDTHTP